MHKLAVCREVLVVLFLLADVINDVVFHGFAYRKGSVTFLPGEILVLWRKVFYPFAGTGFYCADKIGYRHGGRKGGQDVYMVGASAYAIGKSG